MFVQDKIRFVEETYPQSEQSRKWVLSTLSLLSPFEEEWGMDFTVQEYNVLQPAFDQVVVATYNGAKTVLIRFRKYAKWRQANGLPCAESVFMLVPNPTVAIRDTMVSSPAHLRKILDVVFDDPVVGSIDVIYRVFLWMGFFGIIDSEAIKVTSDEVDFFNMMIMHDGREYIVYPESKYDFRVACDIREFKEKNRYFRRVEGTEIMRGKANKRSQSLETTLKHTIRPTLARRFALADEKNQESDDPIELGLSLTFNKVYMSGIYYRLYQEERNGNPPDFTQFALSEFEKNEASDKPYKVTPSNPKAAILLRLKKSAETDYYNWKNAFHL